MSQCWVRIPKAKRLQTCSFQTWLFCSFSADPCQSHPLRLSVQPIMSTLASRFAALRQSERRSSVAVSPRRLTPTSPTSAQQRSSNGDDDDDDSVFPPLRNLIANTPTNAIIGQRRRRNSEEDNEDNEANSILQARQAQLDRDRTFAKERMKYHSVTDVQAEIDITAFSAVSFNVDWRGSSNFLRNRSLPTES